MSQPFLEPFSYIIARFSAIKQLDSIAISDCLGSMGQVLGANRISCFLFTPQFYGWVGEWDDGTTLAWGDFVFRLDYLSETARNQLHAGQVVWMTADELIDSEFKDILLQRGTQSLVFAPVVYQGYILGVILAEQLWENRVWAPDECFFLKNVAALISLKSSAGMGSDDSTEERLRISQQDIIGLSCSRSFDELAQKVCQVLFDTGKVRIITFHICEEGADVFSLVGQVGLSEQFLPPFKMMQVAHMRSIEYAGVSTVSRLRDVLPEGVCPLDLLESRVIPVKVIINGLEIIIQLIGVSEKWLGGKNGVAKLTEQLQNLGPLFAHLYSNMDDSARISEYLVKGSGSLHFTPTIGTFIIDIFSGDIRFSESLQKGFTIPFSTSLMDLPKWIESSFYPDDYKEALLLFDAVGEWSVGNSSSAEFRIRMENGDYHLFHFSFVVTIDTRSGKKMIYGHLSDTGIWKEKLELDKRYRKLQQALSLAGLGYWEYRFEKREFWFSSIARSILELPDHIVNYDDTLELFLKEDREVLSVAILKCAAGMDSFSYHLKLRDNETLIHAQAQLEYADGNPVLLSGYLVDATKQVKWQEQSKIILDQNTILQQLLVQFTERWPIGVLLKIPNFSNTQSITNGLATPECSVFCNPALSRFLGRSRKDIVEKLETSILDGSFFGITEALAKDLGSGIPVQVDFLDTQGVRRRLVLHSSKLIFAKMHLELPQFIVEDITDYYSLLEENERNQRMDILSGLANSIGLEFNNMLHAIQGYGELVVQTLHARTETWENMQLLLGAAARAQRQVRRLLDLGSDGHLQLQACNLEQLWLDSLDDFRIQIGKKITIETNAARGEFIIQADEPKIREMFLTIGKELGHILDVGDTIRVAFSMEQKPELGDHNWNMQQYASFTIRIWGGGMIRLHLEQSLERGLGFEDKDALGMAEVFATIRKHQGSLHLDSDHQTGVPVLEILLPMFKPTNEHTTSQKVTDLVSVEHLDGVETVLLAEDEALVRRLGVYTLKKAGYTVLEASNGEEALRVYEQNAGIIDILVFDIMMPEMTGREAYERIAAVSPNIPVIFCSGFTGEQLQSEYLLEIKGGFLQKPFRPNDLLAKIREILNTPK
jgi:CheY-like chemotaxis protein